MMRFMLKLSIALVALSAGLLVGSVRAAEVPGIVPPPAVYDHKPTMPIEEHILPLEQVKDFCRHHWNIDPKGSYNGCALSLSGGLKCIVYRIADDRVRRHEYGHCNGWPPDHSVAGCPEAAAGNTNAARGACTEAVAHGPTRGPAFGRGQYQA
jgi:hypothetical protein